MKQNNLIDVRTISSEKLVIEFCASEKEKTELENRFEIPKIINFQVCGFFIRNDLIEFQGHMQALMERVCVSTLEKFQEKMDINIHLLFSETATENENWNIDEEIILPVKQGKINLFDVFAEEFGVSLNPFPKSTDSYLDYRDPSDNNEKENPFSVLKKLKEDK